MQKPITAFMCLTILDRILPYNHISLSSWLSIYLGHHISIPFLALKNKDIIINIIYLLSLNIIKYYKKHPFGTTVQHGDLPLPANFFFLLRISLSEFPGSKSSKKFLKSGLLVLRRRDRPPPSIVA